MATPLTLETPVGYVSSEDVYISYREYYGDGTIYGRVELLTPEGEPVKGAGKTKVDLINANVVLGDNVIGAIGGDLVGVPNEVVPEVAAAPVEEAPVAPVEEAPVVAVEEAPADSSCGCKTGDGCSCCSKAGGECSCCCKSTGCACPCNASPVKEDPVSDRYTVSLSIFGFAVTREFTVKIDNATRNIYLS